MSLKAAHLGFCCTTFLFSSALHAQFGIDRQLVNYQRLYARYGVVTRGQTADARRDRGEVFGVNASGNVRQIPVVRFAPGDGFPVRPEGPIDVQNDKAVAQLECPTKEDYPVTSTMTLYKVNEQPRYTKLVGAAHGVIVEPRVRELAAQGLSEDELWGVVEDTLRRCTLVVTDKAGRVTLEVLRMVNYQMETLLTDTYQKRDLLFIEIAEPSKYLQPVQIRRTSAEELAGTQGAMNSYAVDVFDRETYSDGRTVRNFPRSNGRGWFFPMHPANKYRHISGLILTDIPSGGFASGALQYNSAGEGVAIHTAGINKDGGPYDGHSRYNLSIVIDAETFKVFRDF